MTNYATWMSNPRVQALTMGQLKLPGTHDSGTYGLTTELSQISYPNIEMLWKLNRGSAPANVNTTQTSQCGPSVAVFKDRLFMAYVADNSSNNLLVTSSSDGVSWSQGTYIGQSSLYSPSLAVLHGRLYIAFVANDDSGTLEVCSTSDGVTWTGSRSIEQTSQCGPSLAAFNGRLYLAFIAKNKTGTILVCSSDGVDWTTDSSIAQTSRCAPSLAAFNGRLYIVFVAKNETGTILVCSTGDGTNWSSQTTIQQRSPLAPSLAVFNGFLNVAFIAYDSSNAVLVSATRDGASWGSCVNTFQASQFGPSLAAFGDRLFLGFVANNSADQILICSSTNGTDWKGVMPGEELYYVGPAMYDFVMNLVRKVSTAQNQTILEQLNGGIRFFDLRVYYDTLLADFYIQHALRGPTLSSVLQQVQQFIAANPSSQELIILQISHTNFANVPGIPSSQLTGDVAVMLTQFLGGHIYVPQNARQGQPFDFNSLVPMRVASITRGTPAVLVMNIDTNYSYETTVINTQGYGDSMRDSGGTDDEAVLAQIEGEHVSANPASVMYQVSWTLTPQQSDIRNQVQEDLRGTAVSILEQLAITANNGLPAFIETYGEKHFNLVTVDRYEEGNSKTVVELLVGLNKVAVTRAEAATGS